MIEFQGGAYMHSRGVFLSLHFCMGGHKGSGWMETERKIVYWEEMKGISFCGGQAGDLDSQHQDVYSDGYILKERKKSWI